MKQRFLVIASFVVCAAVTILFQWNRIATEAYYGSKAFAVVTARNTIQRDARQSGMDVTFLDERATLEKKRIESQPAGIWKVEGKLQLRERTTGRERTVPYLYAGVFRDKIGMDTVRLMVDGRQVR
jgi:hypothetical protein